jgi:hypothetical protein
VRAAALAASAAVAAVLVSSILAQHLLSRHTGTRLATADVSTSSPAPQQTAPAVGPPVPDATNTTSGHLLAWAPVANASAYTIEILRGGQLIYSSTTRRANVGIPGGWRRDGQTITLSPGTYRWYVWPVFGSGATRHQGRNAVIASVLAIAP